MVTYGSCVQNVKLALETVGAESSLWHAIDGFEDNVRLLNLGATHWKFLPFGLKNAPAEF